MSSGLGEHLVQESALAAVRALALRNSASPLPPGGEVLVSRGLAEASGCGFRLTSAGYRLHRALLDRERLTLDLATLGLAYAPFASLSQHLDYLRARWDDGPTDLELVACFSSFVSLAQGPLRRAAHIVSRFEVYGMRLDRAAQRLRNGDLRFAVDPGVDSIALIWGDLHEDYLQTLGQSHEVVFPRSMTSACTGFDGVLRT